MADTLLDKDALNRAQFGLSGDSNRTVVCVQGLGYVGSAMAVATAAAWTPSDELCFDVIGVDLDTEQGRFRVGEIAAGRFPFGSLDDDLIAATAAGHEASNLTATVNPQAFQLADVVVVDVHLDVSGNSSAPAAELDGFKHAIEVLGCYLKPEALVMVETTVPPGTCVNVVLPILQAAFKRRGLDAGAVRLAHSYERVMPGPDYLRSIRNFWRVYAASDDRAAHACERFLKAVIDTGRFPLRRMNSMVASETAKVLENSYRAANIALMEEWGQFAEHNGIDLFEVLEAIRDRPTHNNIRQPGFGVGGYCLTKDPLFPMISADQYVPDAGLEFPFARLTVETNKRMPLRNLERIESLLGGDLTGKVLCLLGLAYRSDVDDTRYSASEDFYRAAVSRGATVHCHDPIVSHWNEACMQIGGGLPDPHGADVVVLAVPHRQYIDYDFESWLGGATPLFYDCDNVLSAESRQRLRKIGCRVESTGRGLGL